MNWELFTNKGLSLERMKNFCHVAEVESFTQAAGGDPNKQTLYSRQIKELEQFFGAELFHRKGRTVTLSEQGKELHLLISEYFAVLEDFHERCSGELGSYTIGSGESVIQWWLIPMLDQIKNAFAKADVIFKNLRTRDIIEGIKKGEIDFGIIRKSSINPDLEHIPVGKLQFACFYPSNAQVKPKDEASLLSHFPLAAMEGSGRYQDFLAELPTKHGVIVRKSVSCSSFPMMAKTLTSIPVAAILPTIARNELDADAYEMVQFESLKPLEQELCICWNKRMASMNPELARLGQALATIMK